MKALGNSRIAVLLALALTACGGAVQADEELRVDERARVVEHDPSVFSADPDHEHAPYSTEEQLKIYGDKQENVNPRALVELGRPIYDVGIFSEPSYVFGKKNPVNQQFTVYGDWRTAIAFNDNGATETSQVATRLNLDLDWKLTGTERVHAIITPLEDNGRFTRHVFGGNGQSEGTKTEFDPRLDALFFEGDLGAIASGLSDRYVSYDLPFAVGLMPLLFQNGIWVDDAFTGFAFSIPARNSPRLDISNYDVTFFAGFDDVSQPCVAPGGGLAENTVRLYGVTGFIEANEGYWEVGYGYTDAGGSASSQSYHNVTGAFTRRYGGRVSNSVRLIGNFGQDSAPGAPRTADGVLVLVENSLISNRPSTLVPYLNLFAGFDRPQSLARAAAAGGVLKNTGILFETDALTGYPTLDASANNTFGGALGFEYLFALDQQLVGEFAFVAPHDGDANSVAAGNQWGVGVRFQRPLDRAWILRADAMYGARENLPDVAGVRLEIRRKF